MEGGGAAARHWVRHVDAHYFLKLAGFSPPSVLVGQVKDLVK